MNKKVYRILSSILVFTMLIAFCIAIFATDHITFEFPSNNIQFMDSWYVINEEGKKEDISFPYFGEKNKKIVMYAKLPELYKDDIIKFRCNFKTVRAYIDDEVIYEAEPATIFKGKTSASGYFSLIPLSEEYSNKIIKLEIEVRPSLYRFSVKKIYITTMADFVLTNVKANTFNIVLSVLFFTVAIISLIIFILCLLNKTVFTSKLKKTFFYITIFTITGGVWLLAHAHLSGILTGNMAFSGILSYLAIMFIPFCVVGVSKSITTKYQKFFLFAQISASVTYILQILLFVFTPLDFTDLIIGTHLQLAFIFASVIYILISLAIKKQLNICFWGVIFIIIPTILLFVALVLYILDLEWLPWVFIGIILLIIEVLAQSINQFYTIVKDKIKTTQYKFYAYNDVLTNIGNRYAYEEKLAELRTQTNKDLTFMVMDINYLKQTNDTYGHEAGDELIKTLAIILHDIFGKYGDCYRIGGDEFSIILKTNDEKVQELLTKFIKEVEDYNKTRTIQLSVSYGYAYSSLDNFLSLEDLIRNSDKNMYEFKKNFYLAHNRRHE